MAEKDVLSHKETIRLIKEAQSGNKEARDILVEYNTRLVWDIVFRKFRNKGFELEDLFQVGCIGLIKAIDYFKTEYNVRFSTYAVPMIHGEIQRFYRDNKEGVRVSRPIKETAQKIITNKLAKKTPKEIAKILEINNLETIETALRYIHRGKPVSVDEVVYRNTTDGEDLTIKDQISGDVNSDNWFDYIVLREALNKLDEQKRTVIELRYFEDKTQKVVAEQLGVSQVHVSRLEARAIKELRKIMGVTEEQKKQEPKGDKDKAIELLQTTSLTLKQIASLTEIPVGTLGRLSKKYRSQEVAKANIGRRAKVI